MLLTRGMPAYIGEAGASIDYFAAIGYPCPPNTNPADHLLDMTNSGMFMRACVGVYTTVLAYREQDEPAFDQRR